MHIPEIIIHLVLCNGENIIGKGFVRREMFPVHPYFGKNYLGDIFSLCLTFQKTQGKRLHKTEILIEQLFKSLDAALPYCHNCLDVYSFP